jgi:hypothetical protein
MKKVNLVGQKFGRLLVISDATEPGERSKWNCLCDCKNTVIVKLDHLRDEHTKSCGCLNLEKMSARAPNMYKKNIKYHPSISSARRVWRRRYRDGGLSFEDFFELTQKNCHYCGDPPNNKANTHKDDPKSSQQAKDQGDFVYNGLDRIDSYKTHTLENVVPCCWHCNYAKRNRSVDEFLDWIKKVYNVNFST